MDKNQRKVSFSTYTSEASYVYIFFMLMRMSKLEFQDKLLFILNKGKESQRLFGDFCTLCIRFPIGLKNIHTEVKLKQYIFFIPDQC